MRRTAADCLACEAERADGRIRDLAVHVCPDSIQRASARRMGPPQVELVDVTVAYRIRIVRPDGHESVIGDWPTRRIAFADAAAWIRANP